MLKLSAAVLILTLLAGFWLCQEPESVEAAQDFELRRGEYLVHQVAKCVSCHSPRDSQGELDPGRLLQGAPIPVSSPFPNQQWAFQAPTIAGLPGWSVPDAVHLLTEGSRPGGHKPRPPMPEYRMKVEDAEAVVSYLMSLR